ncbi:MAG: cytochrome c oxidase assembly protein [Deltaproteobacteria bacterium]|nr:cytochrome c oxidase assembly protein [Deltaproteobacteria bacterium]
MDMRGRSVPWSWLWVTAVLVAWTAVALVLAAPQVERPEQVARRYVQAFYSHHYETAYDLLSESDRQAKSREDYLRERGEVSPLLVDLSTQLAGVIRYEEVRVEPRGPGASVTLRMRLPEGPRILEELLAGKDPDRLSQAEQAALTRKLQDQIAAGNLPRLDAEQRFDLVRERGEWRLFLNWAESVRIAFDATVKAGLPWAFRPVQREMLVQPGEFYTTYYVAKNLSDKSVTAKAVHVIEPAQYGQYLNVVQCFCFVQDTLQPGEEKRFPLSFLVSYDLPETVKRFRMQYDFYPIDRFPDGGQQR